MIGVSSQGPQQFTDEQLNTGSTALAGVRFKRLNGYNRIQDYRTIWFSSDNGGGFDNSILIDAAETGAVLELVNSRDNFIVVRPKENIIADNTLSFSGDTITSTDKDLSIFTAGQFINISGTPSNNINVEVNASTATTLSAYLVGTTTAVSFTTESSVDGAITNGIIVGTADLSFAGDTVTAVGGTPPNLSAFTAGDIVTVTDTINNNGNYQVNASTASTISFYKVSSIIPVEFITEAGTSATLNRGNILEVSGAGRLAAKQVRADIFGDDPVQMEKGYTSNGKRFEASILHTVSTDGGILDLTNYVTNSIYYLDADTSQCDVNLPSQAESTIQDIVLTFKRLNVAANICRLVTVSTQTIDGVNNVTLAAQYDTLTIHKPAHSAEWFIIGQV